MSVRAALPRCPFVRLLALPYLRPPFLPPLRELDLLRFFPRPPSAFFTATLVRLIHGRPCLAFRFFAAYSAFLIASFNLRCLSFLLRCVFLLASSCHELPRSQVSGYNNAFRAWLGPTFVL